MALGYLNPDYLVGGELEIDAELAKRVLDDEIARPLGLGLETAALGVHTVINSTMVRAVRAVSSEIGRDPKEFVLFAFGGSGPVHSATLARAADIPHVVVPPAPGVFSALGLLFSTVEHQYVHTIVRNLESVDVATLDGHFAQLEREARDTLRDEGFADTHVLVRRFVDLRYPGQTSEITIEVPGGPISGATLGRLAEAFHAEHENTYGHRSEEGESVELVNVRSRARGLSESDFTPEALALAGTRRPARGAPQGSRRAYFGETHGWIDTPVVARADLDGTPRGGPLVIEEYDTTVVVPPGCDSFVDDADNIRIDVDPRGRGPGG